MTTRLAPAPFDERARLCDNRLTVSTFRFLHLRPARPAVALAFALTALAALTLGACEKRSDLPRMKDEALATAKSYQHRFDELAQRLEALSQRARTMPDALAQGGAGPAFRRAQGRIEEYRRNLQQVPSLVDTGMQTGKPEEMMKLIDGLRERFEHGVVETTSELSAAESQLALAAHHISPRATPEPAAEPAPAEPAHAPTPDR